MRPREIHAADQLAAIRHALPESPGRVLDVGCGRGSLAAALLAAGQDVTAIDPNPEAVDACHAIGVPAAQAALEDFEGSGFDAVIFSRSLHHVADLAGAVDHAASLLSDGGALILDEFDRTAADDVTAAWFYGTHRLLATMGAIVDGHDHPTPADPVAQWAEDLAGEPPLHTGAEMLDAVRARFAVEDVQRVDGAWIRYCQWLADTDQGGVTAAGLRDLERYLLGLGVLVPVGLRVTARRRR